MGLSGQAFYPAAAQRGSRSRKCPVWSANIGSIRCGAASLTETVSAQDCLGRVDTGVSGRTTRGGIGPGNFRIFAAAQQGCASGVRSSCDPGQQRHHNTAAVVPWPTAHPRDLLHLTPTSEPGWTQLQAGAVRWSAEPAKVAYSQLSRISGMRRSASSGSTTTELPGPAHGQKMQRSWLKSSQNERTIIANTTAWSWSDRVTPNI